MTPEDLACMIQDLLRGAFKWTDAPCAVRHDVTNRVTVEWYDKGTIQYELRVNIRHVDRRAVPL